ncbi:hypothetical protein HYS84_01780 [Candidatus Saccharibacteria bacterium]|nr:hypothetical protein [Candidatus Saccharibacteria bacterium]
MRPKEALAITSASMLLAAGCGGNHNSASQEATRSTATTEEQAPDPTQLMIESLNSFRNRVLFQHKAPEILLGSCVAWGNVAGGITVTLNPGIGKVDINGEKRSFFVFSTHDPRYKHDWGPLNGPEVGSPEVMTLVFMPRIVPKGSIEDRKISKQEKSDRVSQRYFVDIQTHEPVMDTVLAEGPLTTSRVARICDALRNHLPIVKRTVDGNKA